MGVIFAASSRGDLTPLPGNVLDKLAHLAVYALLGALVVRALGRGRLDRLGWRHVAGAVLLSTLYGISDEWHQGFVAGRTPDAWDVVADALGAGMGSASVLSLRRMVPERGSSRER
jgi:VanZ family protein